jgi:hypothetical protein
MSISKIYYFGNPYLEQDNLAVKVSQAIKNEFPDVQFIHITNTFQLLDLNLDNSLLFDVAEVPKPMFISTDKVIPPSLTTTHDFDLGFFLKLIEKKADLFVIPKNYDFNLALKETRVALSAHLSN